MKTNTAAPSYKGFRFPPEIMSHAVWLYFRFSLSFRDVEELLAQRGSVVTYEMVRQWCLKFGQTYANELRRRRPVVVTNGIWTRFFSRSMESSTSGQCHLNKKNVGKALLFEDEALL